MYGLNTDIIYQKQWASIPVDKQSIKVRYFSFSLICVDDLFLFSFDL